MKTHRIFPPSYLFYGRQSLCFLRRLCRLRIRCRVPKLPVNQPLYREQGKVKQFAQNDRWQTSRRTLFSRYSSPSSGSRSSFPAPSLGQARSSSGPPSKRKKSNVFVVKETWTHDFFCLANHRQEQVPSRAEKFQLQDAGLGRKTIVFNRRDQAITFVVKLESIYPKLKDGGGFELLRSGPSNKDLVVITPPASGYSVPFLRESSGLGQAVAYIRPLQKSLNTCTVAAHGLVKVGLH